MGRRYTDGQRWRHDLLEVDQSHAVNSCGVHSAHSTDSLRGLAAKHPRGNRQGVDPDIQQCTPSHVDVIHPFNLRTHLSNELAVEVVYLADSPAVDDLS